jgi:hypothetical protein
MMGGGLIQVAGGWIRWSGGQGKAAGCDWGRMLAVWAARASTSLSLALSSSQSSTFSLAADQFSLLLAGFGSRHPPRRASWFGVEAAGSHCGVVDAGLLGRCWDVGGLGD